MIRLFLLLTIVPFAFGRTSSDAAECRKKAKVDNYLETATEIFEKLRDNMPENGVGNCACAQKPLDCSELLTCGFNESGIYRIWPRNRIIEGSIDVYCDMESENGGWTVIQRRGDFKRPDDFFYKNWHKYRTGFGDLRKDFWLGNDKIYALTNQNKYYLLIQLESENEKRSAFYDQFWIDNEQEKYRLHVHDYSGDAGDSFAHEHNGHMFSTMDRDNDNSTEHCAEKYQGGWWYTRCYSSNLNGLYSQVGTDPTAATKRMSWKSWSGVVLNTVEMKIRPSDFKMHLLDMGVDAV